MEQEAEELKTYRLTPSAFKTMQNCHRCFWRRINDKVYQPLAFFPSLPNGLDFKFKDYFDDYAEPDIVLQKNRSDSYAEQGTVPPELGFIDGDVRPLEDRELLHKWRGGSWKKGFTSEKWDKDDKGIRWYDAEGNSIGGYADEVVQVDGKLLIIDYKTRGFPLKEDTHEMNREQLNIYNFALRELGHETMDYSLLMFYHPKEVLISPGGKEMIGSTTYGDVIGRRYLSDIRFFVDIVQVPVTEVAVEPLMTEALEILRGDIPPPAKAEENKKGRVYDCDFCNFSYENLKLGGFDE